MVPASWMDRNPEVDRFVEEQPGQHGKTVALLVDLVRETLPDAKEKLHHGAPWFQVDGQMVCYVAAHSKHVNLGFRYGALLDDPDGLLEGTGKQMRHVKLRDPAAIPQETLARLLKRAAALEPPG